VDFCIGCSDFPCAQFYEYCPLLEYVIIEKPLDIAAFFSAPYLFWSIRNSRGIERKIFKTLFFQILKYGKALTFIS